MNKTAQTELHRLFLIEGLPEPLTAASSHLQIFDNYILNTRLRLRKIRDPHSDAWTRILQQRSTVVKGQYGNTKLAEIYLNDVEYSLFEHLEGREVRKNRYFHEYDNISVAFDVYLGVLIGLTTARIDFEDHATLEKFVPPPFAIIEITDDVFFTGENLVLQTSADIRSKLGSSAN